MQMRSVCWRRLALKRSSWVWGWVKQMMAFAYLEVPHANLPFNVNIEWWLSRKMNCLLGGPACKPSIQYQHRMVSEAGKLTFLILSPTIFDVEKHAHACTQAFAHTHTHTHTLSSLCVLRRWTIWVGGRGSVWRWQPPWSGGLIWSSWTSPLTTWWGICQSACVFI
jgi:hypothetical protein